MDLPNLSFPVLITICITLLATLITSSNAQNSPQDYVNAHNQARSQVGVGPVSWDLNLTRYAQNYANSQTNCRVLVHSGGPYGENLAAGSGDFMTGTYAVKMWVDEKAHYNYASNSCASGKVCGHYTQVVWRDSVRIGCFRRWCNDGWYYVICSYAPPGNFIGRRPY